MKEIFDNVEFGENVIIENFVKIGEPPLGSKNGDHKTIIGDNCVIKSFSIIKSGTSIGENCFISNGVVLREFCNIGNDITIGNNTVILPYASINDNVKIHTLVEIAEYTTINEGTWIGPGVIMANTLYPKPYNHKESKTIADKKGAPIIGKDVRIGINCCINPFVRIGDNSIVGSGSVIIENIPNNSLVVGNPGKIIKKSSDIVAKFDDRYFPYNKKN